MQNVLRSFAVGASLNNGVFLALLLKLRFDDGSEMLTAWTKPQISVLIKILLKYQNYLHQSGIYVDSESIENIIHGESPDLSRAEIENLPVQSVIETTTGLVQKDNNLSVSIKRARNEKIEIFLLSPNQCQWLIGFIFNTLNEFSEDGELSLPNGLPH